MNISFSIITSWYSHIKVNGINEIAAIAPVAGGLDINSDIDDNTKNKILVITSCANHRASIIEHNIIVIEWYILQLKKLFTN